LADLSGAKDGPGMSTSHVEKRLTNLGLELPPDWTPRGQFLPFRKDGAIVYLSGQICEWGGEVTHAGPVLDTPDTIEVGREAAKICALSHGPIIFSGLEVQYKYFLPKIDDRF
jgi:hypothetical protein